MTKTSITYSLAIVFAILLCSFSSDHDFFISITSIEYNSNSKTLEISNQFTAHDLEKAILEETNIDLNIGEPNEYSKADSLIYSYIKANLLISTEQQIKLKFIGKEFTMDENVWIYLESTPIEKPKEITISNTALTEIFSSQSNITHVNFGTKQETYSYNVLNKTHTFLIK